MIFVDTETTGLRPYDNQICQLSYIKTDEKLNILIAKNFFLDVDVPIEPGAERTHGLSKEVLEKLSKGTKFKDIAEEVKMDFEGEQVVCHNANFDLGFIRHEMKRANKSLNIKSTFCTMEHYTDIVKIRNYYGYKWPKLEEVISFLNLDVDTLYKSAKDVFGETNKYHDSRFDIYLTLEIYKNI